MKEKEWKKNERGTEQKLTSELGKKKKTKREINALPVVFLGLVKVMGPYMKKALHFLVCSQILNEIGGQEGG